MDHAHALLLRRCLIALLLCTAKMATLSAQTHSPLGEAEVALTAPYEWMHEAKYSQYLVLIRRVDTSAIVHSTTLNSNDPALCAADTQRCALKPGMAGFPALETRAYEWAMLGFNTQTSTWQWTGPYWVRFYPLPAPPSFAVATWTGNQLQIDWGPAPNVAAYRADVASVFAKDFTVDFACAAAPCTGTEDVTQIPFGTLRILMRSCGLHGRCTRTGATTEAFRVVPTPVEAPNIALPTANGSVTGMTSLVWHDQPNIERWNVRIEKDTGGPLMQTWIEEAPWRNEQVACGIRDAGRLCTRHYALSPGTYLVILTSYAGGVWGPSTTSAFDVTANVWSPRVLAPASGAVTSVYPLLVWRRVPDQDRYVLSVTGAGGDFTADVTCTTAICRYDFADHGRRVEGVLTWSVRVGAEGMPLTPATTFTASYSYEPPRPVIIAPEESIGTAERAGVAFTADAQVPWFVAQVSSQNGLYSISSPKILRHESSCQLFEASGTIRQNCTFTSPLLTQLGWHRAVVQAHSNKDALDATRFAQSDARDFIRQGGQNKDIYTIYAQNTQFLPAILKGGASSAYGMSDAGRALALIRYIRKHDFDVVALSEVFTDEAKDMLSLHMLNGYPWQFGHIDTAGDIAFTFREGFITEQDSGLAVYSQFPAHYVPNKGWNDNSQCTSDLFNQISETHPAYESVLMHLNDYLWFNQYCEAEGVDAMSAKGMAAVRLQNPRTGAPLLVAWSHTQAQTDRGPIPDLIVPNDYSYEDSYAAREAQIKEARDSLAHLLSTMPNRPYDAFVLGDWNVPQPAAVGRPPSFDPATNTLTVGGGVLADLFDSTSISTGVLDLRNPKYRDLVGQEHDPTPDGQASPETLYSQYYRAFDPRNSTRYLRDFYDLWLENPAGDFGYTFDLTGRRSVVACAEVGEPCHQQHPPFDSGQRFDTVLARFHSSNIANTERTRGSYPGGEPSPAWQGKRSCVQHAHLARDFKAADHFGTIIEVGPEAKYCSPSTGKADPHLHRSPGSPPPPADNGFDAHRGIHNGNLSHGGANEWFYVSHGGGIDAVLERRDASIPRITIEAYPANDISERLPVADSEQHVDGVIAGAPECNTEIANQSIERDGHIPHACASVDSRVTYWSPGPMYLRIYAANADGTRCTTCVGNFRMRFRERTCKVDFDAVIAPFGLAAPGEVRGKGWFGEGQPRCWFDLSLRQPTLPDDPQTLRISNLDVANDTLCNATPATGSCESVYRMRLWEVDNDPGTRDVQIKSPLEHLVFQAPSDPTHLLLTGNAWRIDEAAKNASHAKKILVEVDRSDPSRPHPAVLPWDTDLKTVRFVAVTTTDIDDDSTSICIPIIGCAPDPFNTEDEGRVRVYINGVQRAFFDRDFEVENGSVDRYAFPNRWPGSMDDMGAAVYGGLDNGDASRGWTINFTGTARVDVEDRDPDSGNDWLVADHLMCGGWAAPPGLDKQTNRILALRLAGLTDPRPSLTRTYDFADENCDREDWTFHYELHIAIPRAP